MKIMPLIICLMMVTGAVMAQEVVTKLDVIGQSIINEELRRTRSSTSANGASILALQADLASKFTSGVLNVANGGTGQDTAQEAIDALLPSQTGNSSKYLTTNGTNASWGTITSTFIADPRLSNLLVVSDDEVSQITVEGNYYTLKEATIYGSGTLTIQFATYGDYHAFAIFRNGTQVGTTRTAAKSWVTYVESISGWSSGDVLSLKIWSTSGTHTGYTAAFRVYGLDSSKAVLTTGGTTDNPSFTMYSYSNDDNVPMIIGITPGFGSMFFKINASFSYPGAVYGFKYNAWTKIL